MKQDKNIDDFSKYLLKDVGLEKPSSNFVAKVINTINIENSKVSNVVYKPIISKIGWFFIAISFIGLMIVLYFSNTESIIQFSVIDLSFFDKLMAINIFENIKLSKIFSFSFMLFSLLVLVQLHFIKKILQ
ncbi:MULTISPECIES: hypothetical protein [Flavobacteriaceae]|uniref:Uncharacterized protein n=2 Tax=Flavobacteriaceae TaxID=49546 RepID=A0A4Y8AYH2_9FLAO|nr:MULTISPECIES: hypothetical protein [Flavobacteriaceae]TEW76918.1 hypothetical protein E2488_03460 [Gramella jeungdoensis]GGK59317.1 hypothetical protein GCM10007963_29380 [Lutibacter litoralis]